jgi:inosine/xanthosine triphosphate pyrophosphatase family protein
LTVSPVLPVLPLSAVSPRDSGLTMAEIPLAEKNRLSHRAAAFRALGAALASRF